ncbi:dTDP-4-dehydrorhamnose reductase family protein [Ferrovum myxofaciens]|uniref:dTDP-4-dehydrorhamnose reductase family protein n=1 Tax=Ferrovum myxofaciens TaxID=416213 RepID=UPI003EB8D4D2
MRILIFGITGMLGSMLFRECLRDPSYETWGTLRQSGEKSHFEPLVQKRMLSNIDILNQDALIEVFSRVCPDVVINCVGVIKQLAHANDPLTVLPVNALLPHRLARLCNLSNARMIHISTDCVFSGRKGHYIESDLSDAEDLYGKSKLIGEIHDQTHVVTLRTSIIGHELSTNHALVDWFLSQKEQVRGFSKAVYSGLPTVELARVIRDFVIPNLQLSGLYHVASAPISKFDLLHLVAIQYGKNIDIVPDDSVVIDRSLCSDQFHAATGYTAPDWRTLVTLMHQSR